MDTCLTVWQSVRLWAINFDNWPTIIIAAAAVFISYQQWKLAQNKFKHDLYEKRLAIYLGAERFLRGVQENGTIIREDLAAISKCIHSSTFLVKQRDFDYLESFYKLGLRYQLLDSSRDKLAELRKDGDKQADEEDTRVLKEIGGILEWYSAQFPVLKSRFAEYLKFD